MEPRTTRSLLALLLALALVVAACGDDGDSDPSASAPADDTPSAPADDDDDDADNDDDGDDAEPAGTEIVVAFDPEAGELPEGIAVGPDGTVYASLAPLGRVVAIDADGGVETVGEVTLAEGDLGVLGLYAGDGEVLAAVFSQDDEVRGVWRFGLDGTSERIADGRIALPNSIAVDGDAVYVTDSIGPNGSGAVWRIDADGMLEVWAEDELLGGNQSFGFPFPIGANGIGIHDGSMYVAVTETARVVRIPIADDGTAGTAELFVDLSASGPDGAPRVPDGLAADADGVYVTVLTTHEVISVASDGEIEVLATAADGLDAPAGVAIGADGLYVTSFSAAIEALTNGQGPSVLRIAR